MLKTVSAKLTAVPGDSGWSQVHEFSPDDPEKFEKRGRLFGVFATRRVEEGVGIVNAGRELLSRLHEEYFGNLEGKPFNALKTALEKVSAEFTENWGDVEIVAASFVDGVIYSASTGGARLMICRDGSLGTILESISGEVVSASGYPKEGDTMLLATKLFFEKVPQGIIKAALGDESLENAIESFNPLIREAENLGTVGAILIRFNGEDKPVATPENSAIIPETKISFAEKITRNIQSVFQKVPRRSIYVRPHVYDEVSSQSKKTTYVAAIVLLLILAIGIGFGIRQKRLNDFNGKYQGLLSQAENDVDQAISLASVDKDRSRQFFTQAEDKLSEINGLKVSDPKIDDLKNKIDTSRASILGEYEANPQLFLDLTLLSSGFNGTKVAFSGGNIYVLDISGKRIISAAIDTKKSKVVAGPNLLSSPSAIAPYEDRIFVLESDGIYEIVAGSANKIVNKTWGGEAFTKAFAGNLYVLDKNGNQIYRYQGNGTAFGDKTNWLASGASVDFSGATQFEIDGSLYVLFPNAKILKFSLGSHQAFNITGAVPEVGNIDAMYADGDNSNLYFLDRAGKRILVTDKNGKYIAQYLNDQIADATSLVASEANGKIILLTGGKLLSIDIKNAQ